MTLRFARHGWLRLATLFGLLTLGIAAGAFAAARSVDPDDVPAGPQRHEDAPPPSAPPGDGGRPVCVRIGTRSEGWAWPSGRFIHWAKCKGAVPKCDPHGKDGSGWYAKGALIANDQCAAPAGAKDKPADARPPAPSR